MVEALFGELGFGFGQLLLQVSRGHLFYYGLFHFAILGLRFNKIVSHDELGLYRKLLSSQAQGLFGHLERNAAHFEHDASGENRSCPVFHVTFTFTLTDFGRLLGNRFKSEAKRS